MFNAKEMKLLKDYKIAQKYLLDGVPVFMVGMDGSLTQLTESTSWQKILFHNLQQGSYAVYRKKFVSIGDFHKGIRIGGWSFTISHTKDGGEN